MAAGPQQEPEPIPLYTLLFLVIGICIYFFFIGTAAVRLWFYKGALGPAPEKFIVIGNEPQEEDHHATTLQSESGESGSSADILRKRRMTVFTHDSLSAQTEYIARSTALDPRNFSIATTTINLQDIEDLSEFKNPQTRAYIAEERRISRMPAFDADDCGTGDYFPDIPLTNKPIESSSSRFSPLTASQLGLTPTNRRDWLTIDEHYIEYHAARTHLLSRNRSSCIHITPEGEQACRELLQEVVSFLVETHPNNFRFLTKHRRKHVLNELTREYFELEQLLECHALEVCARLCAEDFQVWGRSESTLMWYLQASTTLFPSGYIIAPYMGKTVDVLVRGEEKGKPPMIPWSTLSSILPLPLPTLSPYSHTGPLTRHQTFIQTRPPHSSLASTLHIPRPIDFFAGNIADLHPSELLVRTETQMFARLPKSGAVIVTTRTSTETLKEMTERMSRREKEEFMRDVEGWGLEEARVKGRELWIGVVERCLKGQSAFRDDTTVYSRLSVM